jgi:bifunctional UDP-N-acetylglucosamine pyrophosphorylase/glucosamine-1-phosphate N-acetyltransferase
VAALDNSNAQGEFYLTDVVVCAVNDGVSVRGFNTETIEQVMGINDRAQLAVQERCYQRRQAEACMRDGVTLIDPARFDLRGKLVAGQDVVIDVNAVLEGEIRLGNRVTIGPNVFMRNVRVGDDVVILANCVIEDADIGNAARIGPFARIRPETRLAEHTHVGNFVEIKKSEIGSGSKINHLSYIGDTTVGSGVNIGAGTITCNYDGANKHRTVIGDDVFIGSDTQLVAPVTVADGATIGAGSTIIRDAPAGELTLSRAEQRTRHGWKRPVKKHKT